MPKQSIYKSVEIQCKTIRKTTCILNVKLCANFHSTTPQCGNPPFTRNFPTIQTPFFTQPSTPNVQLFYPLFQQAYYYNYKII